MTGSTRGVKQWPKALPLAVLLTVSLVLGCYLSPPARSEPDSFPANFYFHRQGSKTINQVGDTLWANTTRLWSALAQNESRQVRSAQLGTWDVYTQPSLAGSLQIVAPVTVSAWLAASTVITRAAVDVALLSVSPTGFKTTLGASSSIQDLAVPPTSFLLNINTLASSTIPAGYILDLQITVNVSGGQTRTVALLFDTASYASHGVLTLTDHFIAQSIAYYNSSLLPTYSFSRNWSLPERQAVVIVNVADALGLYDVSQVKMTVTSPLGGLFANNVLMTKITGLDTSYSGLWQVTLSYTENDTSGVYRGRVTVWDLSGNMRISLEYTFIIFAQWPFSVSTITAPPSSIPLESVQVRVVNGSTVVWSALTDSLGIVNGFLRDDTQYDIEAYWQGSLVGTASNVTISTSASLGITLQVRLFAFSGLFQDGEGRPLDTSPTGLVVNAPNGSVVYPSANASYYMQDGRYEVNTVIWEGRNVAPSGAGFDPASPSVILLKIYDLSIIVTDEVGRSIAEAEVTVISSGTVLASGRADAAGLLYLRQLPAGEYAVTVRSGQESVTRSMTFDRTQTVTIQLAPASPAPSSLTLQLFGLVALSASLGLLGVFGLRKVRSLKFSEKGFDYLDAITGGGIPKAASLLITGDAGSGKTLLSEQLLADGLRKGRSGVYISYGSSPDELRKRMGSHGLDLKGLGSAGKFAIIDCYSSQAKLQSSAKYFVDRPFELTALGISLSQALKDVDGNEPLVIIDSLSNLFSKVDPGIVVGFLGDKAAKVKGMGGNMIFTMGAGTVPKEVTGNIEGLADGILQLSATQGKEGISRSLRVRKMRNQVFKEAPFDFKIKAEKGIRFVTKRGLP